MNEVTGDSRYSNRYLWNVFSTYSNTLTKEDSDKGKSYNQSNIWETICLKMKPVSISLCTCINLPVDCVLYRSEKELPKLIESTDGFVYRFIATPDLSKDFTLVTPYTYQVRSKLKYNRTKYAFIHENRLYTPNASYSELIISGIFEEVPVGYKCNEEIYDVNSSCKSYIDKKITLNDYLVSTAIRMTLQELFPTKTPKDEIVNNNINQKEVST